MQWQSDLSAFGRASFGPIAGSMRRGMGGTYQVAGYGSLPPGGGDPMLPPGHTSGSPPLDSWGDPITLSSVTQGGGDPALPPGTTYQEPSAAVLAAGSMADSPPSLRIGTYALLAILGGLSGYFLMKDSRPLLGSIGGAVLAGGAVFGTDMYLMGVEASKDLAPLSA